MVDAREVARRFDDRHRIREQCASFGAQRHHGRSAAIRQVLHLEDLSAIPFLSGIRGIELYQHRARVRARHGSLFAAVTPPVEGYEPYCRRLGLGEPEFVAAEPESGDLLQVARSCMHGSAFERIVEHARGGLVIHPYMGSEPVWMLARAVAAEAKADVSVISPEPPVTAIANDKAAIAELAAEACGEEILVRTERSSEPEAIAESLGRFARRARRVGLKRTRCASAMGNRVFTSRELAGLSPPHLLALVRRFLDETEWDGLEEVLVVEWEDTDCSPSTQLWIPPFESQEQVQLDGVYEQILEGEARVFVGSRPSTLPERVNERLGRVSLAVGAVLQELGYVGRCSFDFLVVGDPADQFEVKLTECNGRWGGTSTPMSLVDRLFPAERPMYRAQDFVHPSLIGMPFTEVLARTNGELFDPGTGQGRFIFYNVGPLARSGKLDVIALGRTKEETDEALLERLPRLLGL
jgi:hypothetical protein